MVAAGTYWVPTLELWQGVGPGTLVSYGGCGIVIQRHDGCLMNGNVEVGYYLSRKDELMQGLIESAQEWLPVLAERHGNDGAGRLLQETRRRFEALIPKLPDIGGDENHLTASLIGSARCLALYLAVKASGGTAQDAGKLLYDAMVRSAPDAPIPPSQRLSREELMQRRRERAEWSQQRRYPEDWMYAFVEGDGLEFDYGYDFCQCATERLYRAQGALGFLPFYCFLDFPQCEKGGLGLARAKTLAEGDEVCDFRFTEGGKASQHWPPPFVAKGKR